jgi:putative membrane protein
LQKAAQGHYAQVALGQLAVQKGSHDQVKQYGARMIQDHQRVGEEVGKLTRQGGSPLPSHLSMQHQQIQQKLSQLSGKDFDIAYISFIVRDHMKNFAELEQGSKSLTTDPRIGHVTASTLPLLKDHLEQAKALAATIGVREQDINEVN